MPPIIEIHNLGKKYSIAPVERYLALRDVVAEKAKNIFTKNRKSSNEFWALQDVNLEIERGERIGIIGRNGAGKSTLLKILSKITPPTTGEIKLRGRVASLLEVGTGFHPELTGRENIYLNGSILGLSKKEIDRKLAEIIDFSGIEKFIDTPLKHYSSGMQLRLAFSVAAHLEPEILLIDEVLAVGDMEFQKKCVVKMEEISRNDARTILFVSHNLGFVSSFCSKAVLLENGSIKNIGETERVLATYLHDRSEQKLEKPVFGNRTAELVDFNISNGRINTSQLLLGYPAVIKVSFRANENLKNVEIAFNIKNMNSELITHITSLDQQLNLSLKKGESRTANIIIHHIHLTPSTYKVDLFILNNDEACWGCYDFEELTVLNSDKALRVNGFPAHVKTFTDTSWEIQ